MNLQTINKTQDSFNPLVSIIVPFYNVENYMNCCIDSLINQSYRNLEIILVDDGSPDDCPKICDEYAEKDGRVKVIHKTNGGISSARSFGLDAAIGEYVMLVDGDDWLDKDAVQSCITSINGDDNVGLVSFPYIREYPNASLPVHFFEGNKRFNDKDAEVFYRQLFGPVGKECSKPEQIDKLVSCCMKLYRSDVAKKGKFFDTKEVGSCEDGLFNMFALHNCGEIVYLDTCFYHYRKTTGTLTSSYRENFITKWNRLFDIIGDIIRDKGLGEEYTVALNNRIAFSCLGIGLNEFSDKTRSFNQHMKVIKGYIKSERYRTSVKYFRLKYLPLKWKIFMFCCKHKMSFSVSVMLRIMMYLKSRV